jgi:hypothetical protein
MRSPKPRKIGPYTHIRPDPGAWTVQVIRRGQTFSGHFSHAVWGGRAPALVAAQRFRDELLLRIEPDTRVRRRVPKGVASATGIVGVSREAYTVGGRRYSRYVAAWVDPEKGLQRKRFGIERYGSERAKGLAREARERGVAESHRRWLALQREAAGRRLQEAPAMPRQVKDPLSRKGINMGRRRARRRAGPPVRFSHRST